MVGERGRYQECNEGADGHHDGGRGEGTKHNGISGEVCGYGFSEGGDVGRRECAGVVVVVPH